MATEEQVGQRELKEAEEFSFRLMSFIVHSDDENTPVFPRVLYNYPSIAHLVRGFKMQANKRNLDCEIAVFAQVFDGNKWTTVLRHEKSVPKSNR